jgi:hypothetical protein
LPSFTIEEKNQEMTIAFGSSSSFATQKKPKQDDDELGSLSSSCAT